MNPSTENLSGQNHSGEFHFGHWLQALRKQLGLTRTQVADKASGAVSQQYIHRIETGVATNIGTDKLAALAIGLGVPVSILHQALVQKQSPEIPLLGRSAAGGAIPNTQEGYQSETISYFDQRYFETQVSLFAMEIIGDSMAPRVEHGDLVFVIPISKGASLPQHAEALSMQSNSADWLNGGMYLVSIDDRLTCKYLIWPLSDHSQPFLRAENQEIFPDTAWHAGCKIMGRVVEVRKRQNLTTAII
jgi:SOS-response transcriptional repressor LexA